MPTANAAGLLARMNSMKFKALLVLGTLVGLVGPASAMDMWTNITAIITGLTTTFLPALVDMVVGMVPILIVLAIVGFVLGFLDKILSMIHMR